MTQSLSRFALAALLLTELVLSGRPRLFAAEPVIEFVEGLRRRGYYDTVEEYLDRVENDPSVPAEIRKRVPYERAVTLTQSALNQRNAELQHRQLDRAAAELQKFIASNPGHALLGDAQSRRGKIFLGKARVAILESRSSANASRRPELEKQALSYIAQARKIFTAARDEYEKRWKSFPTYIPPDQKAKLAERKSAEVRLMLALIDLALTTYEEAQVYKTDYDKQKERTPKNRRNELKKHPYYVTLDKAAREFEAIHTRYRSQVAGLYARMWQGKCFEEQDEIGRALGIYNELLDHPGTSPTLKNLQRQVLSFKLICLNHEQRKDYHLVEQAATDWLKKNRRYQRTETGLRILFERARAREALGLGADPNLSETQRKQFLRLARQDAEFVNRFPGKFKDVSTLMLSRIKRALGIAVEDPDNFPDAYSAAQIAYNRIKIAQEELQKARAQNKPKKETEALAAKVQEAIGEAIRLFRLSLKLAKPGDDQDKVNRARFILAYLYYQFQRQERAYDAAVLADFVARHYKEQDPDTARDAAYLAMAADVILYNQAPAGQRQTEMRWIIQIARYIVATWPGSDRAVAAAFNLGDMYNQQERYFLAARWYSQIPESAKDQYALSLLNAGTNYWGHYSISAGLEPDRNTYLKVLRESVGEDWVGALADLLNPSWNEWQKLRRLNEIDQMLAASSAGTPPAAKPAKGKKQPPKTAKAKGASKKSPQNPKKKPPKKGKAAGGKNGKNKKLPPASVTAARNKEIQRLQAQSAKELRNALARLTGKPAAQFQKLSETALRKELLGQLQKLNTQQLQSRFEQQLTGMDEERLKHFFRQKLDQWQTLAAWYLAKGIQVMESQLTPGSQTPEDLVRAKLAFAEYALATERYPAAIRLLGDISADNPKPHTVLAAIRVPDESQRPADRSIKGRDFASAVYQTVALVYLGADQLDKFKKALNVLKQIVSTGNAEDLTDLYSKLGRQLQKAIERLKNAGNEDALKAKRDIFRRAFATLLQAKDQLDFSLLMWIGEASYALGAGLGNPTEATPYFEKAAEAYQLVLQKKTGQTLSEDQRLAVQLRLLNCRRRQKKYDEALQLAKKVIAQRENLLPAQVEAAYALQNWASDNGEEEKFLDARAGLDFDDPEGSSQKHRIWGWNDLADRLLQQAVQFNPKKSPEDAANYRNYFERYLGARYNLTWCLYQYGLKQNDSAKKKQALNDARRELLAFGRKRGDIDERPWKFEDPATGKRVAAKQQFEKLYDNIQLALGIPQANLENVKWGFKELARQRQEKIAKEKKKATGKKPVLAQADKAGKKPEESSGVLGMIFGLLFLVVALAGGGWFLFNNMKGQKRKRPLYAYTTGTPSFGTAPSRGKTASAGKTGKVRKAAAGKRPASQTSGQTRTSAAKKRPAGGSRPASSPPRGPQRKPPSQPK